MESYAVTSHWYEEFDLTQDQNIHILDLQKGKYVSTNTVDLFSECILNKKETNFELWKKYRQNDEWNKNEYSDNQLKNMIKNHIDSLVITNYSFINTMVQSKGKAYKKLDISLVRLLEKYKKTYVRTILVPYWYNSHWTLYKINLHKRKVSHYDSLLKLNSRNESIPEYFKAYFQESKFINKMLEQIDESMIMNKCKEIKDESFNTFVKNSPQQSNTYDWGIFWMMNIYAIFNLYTNRGPNWDSVVLRKVIFDFITNKNEDLNLDEIFKSPDSSKKNFSKSDFESIFKLIKN